MSDSLQPHELWFTRLLCLWNSPGKNIGVGCHSFPSPGCLPIPGIKPGSPVLRADSLLSKPTEKPPCQGYKSHILGEQAYRISRNFFLQCILSQEYSGSFWNMLAFSCTSTVGRVPFLSSQIQQNYAELNIVVDLAAGRRGEADAEQDPCSLVRLRLQRYLFTPRSARSKWRGEPLCHL